MVKLSHLHSQTCNADAGHPASLPTAKSTLARGNAGWLRRTAVVEGSLTQLALRHRAQHIQLAVGVLAQMVGHCNQAALYVENPATAPPQTHSLVLGGVLSSRTRSNGGMMHFKSQRTRRKGGSGWHM